MKILVLYFDDEDKICMNYAREISNDIYVLPIGEKPNFEKILPYSGNLLEDIKKYEKTFDLIVIRKRANYPVKNFEFGHLIKNLRKYRLLVVN